MIKVCLNFKIHIPAVRTLNEFLKTNFYLQNNSNNEAEKSIVEKYTSNLLPFLRGLESIHLQSKGKFRAGLSINGITLMNLLNHAPDVVDQLKKMHEKGCFEILSEPWSHSIVPFFDKHALIRQIKLHDISIQSVFGVTPEIFIVHSPIYLLQFVKTVSSVGKKAVFTNLNQFNKDAYKNYVLENIDNVKYSPVLPINYKISNLLQRLDFNPGKHENSGFSKGIVNKFKNYVTDNNPVILVYNLTQIKNFSHISRTVTWHKFLRDLLAHNIIIFTTPSESVKKNKAVNYSNNLLDSVFYRSTLDNMWVENKFQNQLFDRQLIINSMMYDKVCKDLVKEWDVLQDMENLFYMNDNFKDNGFAKHYFNLFEYPETAFISYMGELDKFTDKILDRKQISFGNYKNEWI